MLESRPWGTIDPLFLHEVVMVLLLFSVLLGQTLDTSCPVSSVTFPTDDKTWNSLELYNQAGLVVRLKIRKEVTPADDDWFVFEFENQTDKPIHLKNGQYSISYERKNLAANQVTARGGRFPSSFTDIFRAMLDSDRGETTLLPAKAIRRHSLHPTENLTAKLLHSSSYENNLWKNGGRDRIKLTVDIDLEMVDERKVFSIIKDSIECDWLYPDEKVIALMQKRMRHLMNHPVRNLPGADDYDDHHAKLIFAYTETPAVAESLTSDELFQAITKRRVRDLSRNYLIGYYQSKFPNDTRWVDYQKSLQQAREFRTDQSNRDKADSQWKLSDLEPFVALYESGEMYWFPQVLLEHRKDWASDPKIVARLVAAAKQTHPILRKELQYLDREQKTQWGNAILELSKIGDPSTIALIQPGLADTETVTNVRHFANSSFSVPPPPLRVCDYALHAMLNILDEDAGKAYRKAGINSIQVRGDIEARLNQLRDAMIEDVKKRIATDNK